MHFKQYYLGCLAHASYLIADEESRIAAVVDPQRDVDQYVADADRLGVEIRHVFLTHFHADFLAGHLELRDRTGAEIHLGATAKAEYAFTPMKDRTSLEFGRVRLTVLETPGHSPESISILVYDLQANDRKPHAVLTGDTLFVGDVGRPDLHGSLGWSAPDLGRLLYTSLHKLLTLPDDTLVYPAHGAGSLCGKQLSDDAFSTIGAQRRDNYALQPMSEEEFVRIVTAEQPDAPPYFLYDAVLNTKEHPTLDKTLERTLQPLSAEALLRLSGQGAQLLDARDPAEFAGAHLVGSLNVGLGGQYATWTGTLLDPEKPIVLIAEPGREEEAARRLGRIGFDRVAGYVDGGMQALDAHPELIERTLRITAATLAERLDSSPSPFVVDVRTEEEWRQRRIRGSHNIPLSRLQERLQEVPLDGMVVVHCASGYRSSIATSLLARLNGPEIVDLVGGMAAWIAANHPTLGSAPTHAA